MSTTYDGALGTTVTVYPNGTGVSVGFDSTVVLLGAMDTANGNASLHEPVFIDDEQTAIDNFGDSSDLTAAAMAARANGAFDLYGVGVDDSSGEPDYTAAAEAAMGLEPRYIYVDSTTTTDVGDAMTVVNDYATDLEFARVFAPITDVTRNNDISAYEPSQTDHRLVEVAPQTATVRGMSTTTAAAVVGHAARKPLGGSMALDSITVDSLGSQYRPSEATTFEGVTAVTKDGTIVDGVTTAEESAFSDIFQMEIVDTVALGLDEVAQDYSGSAPNTEEERDGLRSDMRIFLNSLASQTPPLLADAFGAEPFAVELPTVGADADQARVTVAVNPVDVMKDIKINLNVGRAVTFDGVEA